jgi:hypothetical protein
MVAILWAEGNVAAALALEELWNDFLMKHPARLFCAYPSTVLDDENKAGVDGVRGCHSHVLVSNSDGR